MTDRELITRVLELESLTDEQREAFEDMAAALKGRPSLTEKQRAWAKAVLGEPTYENLVSSGRVPRGREVPPPPVLQPANLPKRPPGRP